MSRESKEQTILDNLDKIKEWAASGLTIAQIAKNLGMARSTLNRYKSLLPVIEDTVKKARMDAVKTLENTMFTSAVGYTRKVKKYQKVKRTLYENGKKAEEWEEMVEYEEEQFYPPDNTAGIFLLKNWGRYSNEPLNIDIRQKELELKEKQLDANSW